MAFDNFNRANETPIASPWVEVGSGSINLASNRMTSVNAGERIAYYSGSVSDPDQFAQATIADRSGTSNDWGPAVRCSSGPNGYWAAGYDPGSSLETYKVVAGSFSSIGSIAKPAAFVNGQIIRVTAIGTEIRYYIDGTLLDTHTDSSLTGAGSGAGVFIYDDAMDIDDWQGGDLDSDAFMLNKKTEANASSTGLTVSHTPGGTAKLTVCCVALRGNQTINSITFGGNAMTLAVQEGKDDDYERTAIYYLVNPPTGASNLVLSLSGSVEHRVSISSWATSSGFTPGLDVTGSGEGASNSVTASVSGASGKLAIDCASTEDNVATPFSANGADQTVLHNSGSGSFGIGTSYEHSPASNETFNWTSGAAGETWAHVVAVFKNSSGGGSQLLGATIAGVSAVAGALKVEKPLGATIAGVSSVAGALQAQKKLAATIASTSTVTAAIQVQKALAATIASVSSAAGALNVQKPLAATIQGVSGVAADLQVSGAKLLAATIDATSSVAGSLAATKNLGATIASTSTVTASIAAAKTMAATVAGSSSVAAALNAGKPLAAAIASTSSFIGRLLVDTGVVATGRVYQSLQMIRTRIGW